MISIWNFISEHLRNESPVMLMYVVESSGSSPGRQGFYMAVDAEGNMMGSIGGGIMEHKLVEMAKEKLQACLAGRQASNFRLQTAALKKQVHNKDVAVDQSGMICSGEQTVFIYQVLNKDLPAIDQIIQTLHQNHQGTLILSPSGVDFTISQPKKNFEFNRQSEKDWIYREKIGFSDYLHIIGGGHCSLALSLLMKKLNFYIHIYENRQDLHTVLINDAAHVKKNVSDYSELTSLIPEGEQQYVVVMTFGYRTDAEVLRALYGKKFKYIGVLGSRNKIRIMLDDLKKEGMPEEFLSSLHAPIGLQIKSETPEEIAVSIAAEIIRVRNASRES